MLIAHASVPASRLDLGIGKTVPAFDLEGRFVDGVNNHYMDDLHTSRVHLSTYILGGIRDHQFPPWFMYTNVSPLSQSARPGYHYVRKEFMFLFLLIAMLPPLRCSSAIQEERIIENLCIDDFYLNNPPSCLSHDGTR